MAFNSIEHDDIQILDACTPMKFSLHVIHRGVVFDNNHRSSCASYVAEFNQFLRDDILRGERRALEATNEMPSTQYIAKTWLRSHLNLIDLSVCKKIQQFRCLGAPSYCRWWRQTSASLHPTNDSMNAWFTVQNFGLRPWKGTIVTEKDPDASPLVVVPSEYSSFVAPLMGRRRLKSPSATLDNMLPTGRYLIANNVLLLTRYSVSSKQECSHSH